MKTNKFIKWILITALLIFGLAACGSGGAEEVGPGDAARGEALFNQYFIGVNNSLGCINCHYYDSSTGTDNDAPFISGLATRAATNVSGFSAEEYILESILVPDAYIVEGYSSGTMNQNWENELSGQEIQDLLAYLLTQE